MKDLPPFLRDTDLRIHFRTYCFNREKPDETENEALAFGGWLELQVRLAVSTCSGSGRPSTARRPCTRRTTRTGPCSSRPGQEGYYVIGEAYAALRYQDYILAKGYRAARGPVATSTPRTTA